MVEHNGGQRSDLERIVSGPARAILRQITFLQESNAFVMLRELQDEFSSPKNSMTLNALVISDEMHFDEKDVLKSLFPFEDVDFQKRRIDLPHGIFVWLKYNRGIPQINESGKISKDTEDSLVVITSPRDIMVSHSQKIDGKKDVAEYTKISPKEWKPEVGKYIVPGIIWKFYATYPAFQK